MSRGVKKRKRLWLVPAAVVSACVLYGAVMVSRGITDMREVSEQEYDLDLSDTGTVTYKGENYRYNDHLSNYLFLGVDREMLADTSVGHADAGQTDAVFLLSWDRSTKAMTVISVPRDTITRFDSYARSGEFMGSAKGHLSLVYAYGDGKHESCRMTADAVSELFYGLPIEGYCAAALDALPALMEEIGEVTVTAPDNSLEGSSLDVREGETVTLDSGNARVFVQYRDITVDNSALSRQKRQEVFIRACAQKAEAIYMEDENFAARAFTAVKPYLVTNMGNDCFVRLLESAAGEDGIERWTLPGEGVRGEHFDEYHVDNEALYEKIIQTFYVKGDEWDEEERL